MKTNKVSKVLIALDYNPTSQKVAEAGYSMAKAMNADVLLLHVISDPDNYSSAEHVTVTGFAGREETVSVKVDNIDKLKKAAHRFLEKSKELLGDKAIKILLKEGEAAESILKASKDLTADLVVMGSHSRRASRAVLMGRVTRKVLQLSSVPILIIPTKKVK
jgi:nucleotide-binding universal stress UspA family protein